MWSGISDKKGWDLLTAISLPLVLFLGAQYFTFNSANEQKKIAAQRYRQELLEKYFSQISELIFKKSQDKKTLTVIRAKTLSVLNELNEDGESKGLILGFLVDSRMIVVSEQQEPVDISHANFGDANLTDANLTRANLKEADLTGAILTGATLTSDQVKQAKNPHSSTKKRI